MCPATQESSQRTNSFQMAQNFKESRTIICKTSLSLSHSTRWCRGLCPTWKQRLWRSCCWQWGWWHAVSGPRPQMRWHVAAVLWQPWDYLPPLGTSLPSVWLPLPQGCSFSSYQLWKAIPVYTLFVCHLLHVFLCKGAAWQHRRLRAHLVLAGRTWRSRRSTEPFPGNHAEDCVCDGGSGARKWPSEEWALWSSKACQPMGERRKQVYSQVPQKGKETDTEAWLGQHPVCCKPASPWAGELEPAWEKGHDHGVRVRVFVYSSFTSVSFLFKSHGS